MVSTIGNDYISDPYSNEAKQNLLNISEKKHYF